MANDFVYKPSKAALAHAKETMGAKAFKSNKDAAQSIAEDFDAGVAHERASQTASEEAVIMSVRINLTIGGDIHLVDHADDDSPLAQIHFSNEAAQIGDAGKVKVGHALMRALREAMTESGIAER